MPDAKKARYDETCQPAGDEHFHRLLAQFTDVQEKLEQLTLQMSEEGLSVIRQVCRQYNSLRAPHYASRALLLKKLPKFWSHVLLNHPLLSPVLTTDDAEILDCLTDVTLNEDEDVQCGFRIEFGFDENPFFEERQLEKVITFSNEGNMIVNGTAPTWKEYMVPKQTFASKAQATLWSLQGPGVKDAEGGPKRKSEKSYSFFLWFGESGMMEHGVQDEMAILMKDDIWPNPMRYYTRTTTETKESIPIKMDVVQETSIPLAVEMEIERQESGHHESEIKAVKDKSAEPESPASFETAAVLPGETMQKISKQLDAEQRDNDEYGE